MVEDKEVEKDKSEGYNFEDTLYYYEARQENNIIGIIDKI